MAMEKQADGFCTSFQTEMVRRLFTIGFCA